MGILLEETVDATYSVHEFTVTQRQWQFDEALGGVLQFLAEQLKLSLGAVFETFRHVESDWHVGWNSGQLRLQKVCHKHARTHNTPAL